MLFFDKNAKELTTPKELFGVYAGEAGIVYAFIKRTYTTSNGEVISEPTASWMPYYIENGYGSMFATVKQWVQEDRIPIRMAGISSSVEFVNMLVPVYFRSHARSVKSWYPSRQYFIESFGSHNADSLPEGLGFEKRWKYGPGTVLSLDSKEIYVLDNVIGLWDGQISQEYLLYEPPTIDIKEYLDDISRNDRQYRECSVNPAPYVSEQYGRVFRRLMEKVEDPTLFPVLRSRPFLSTGDKVFYKPKKLPATIQGPKYPQHYAAIMSESAGYHSKWNPVQIARSWVWAWRAVFSDMNLMDGHRGTFDILIDRNAKHYAGRSFTATYNDLEVSSDVLLQAAGSDFLLP